MLYAKDYKPGDPIYTYVDNSGVNIHIDAAKLRIWCLAVEDELPISMTPVDPRTAYKFVTDNIVCKMRVAQLMERTNLDPIIYAKDGNETNGLPNVMLVDGHHRYTAAAVLHTPFIPAFILEPTQWRPFQIAGLPDITKDHLLASPNRPRNY